jgi:hypothetical protein
MVMVKQQTSEETCNQNGAEETIIACFPASVGELHQGYSSQQQSSFSCSEN